jgi:hypothetical protein
MGLGTVGTISGSWLENAADGTSTLEEGHRVTNMPTGGTSGRGTPRGSRGKRTNQRKREVISELSRQALTEHTEHPGIR